MSPAEDATVADDVLRQALVIAQDMVEGQVSPHSGAANIWLLSSENGRAQFDELRGFIAAASQYDEVPHLRAELAEDAMQSARDLLARHRV